MASYFTLVTVAIVFCVELTRFYVRYQTNGIKRSGVVKNRGLSWLRVLSGIRRIKRWWRRSYVQVFAAGFDIIRLRETLVDHRRKDRALLLPQHCPPCAAAQGVVLPAIFGQEGRFWWVRTFLAVDELLIWCGNGAYVHKGRGVFGDSKLRVGALGITIQMMVDV